jgi:fatty acid desaturase
MRPPDVLRVAGAFIGVPDGLLQLRDMVRHALGRLNAEERDFIPEGEVGKVAVVARVWMAIYVWTIMACFATGSILPLMLIGLPRFYGAWHHVMTGLTQHIGLAEDVLDYRLNCRTVYINPFSRFVYWNMNYHVEHHMFPMVPYHALPQLHDAIKADCATPYSSFWHAYREILSTLRRQLKDPTHFVHRELPPTAGHPNPGPLATELGFAPATVKLQAAQ